MLTQDSVIKFDDDNEEIIRKQLRELFEYEDTLETNSNVKLDLKGKSLDVIAIALDEAMSNDNLRNSQLILNIVCLLKTYLTFDKSFFDAEDIYVTNTISLIDLKKKLKGKIDLVSRRLCIYFISICKSLNKLEYTMLDSYKALPNLYHTILMTTDMVTISSILCGVKDGSFSECILVRDANLYFNAIVEKYFVGHTLMNHFLDPILKSGDIDNANNC